jgi:hypothetical protein
MGDYGKLYSHIWQDAEFAGTEGLDARVQLVFLLLLSFPTRNNAGVLPLTIKRWARASRDGTVGNVTAALRVLEAGRFIVIDWETEEVLIRTFIRNDELYKKPNVMKNALKDVECVESALLKQALADELHRLIPMQASIEMRQLTADSVKRLVETLPQTLSSKPNEGPIEGFLELGNESLHYSNSNSNSNSNEPPPSSGVVRGELVPVTETKPDKARGTRLPENWEPGDDLKSELRANFPNLKLGQVLEEFRDYWLSVPGQRGRKVDWDRTFRNRVREVADQPRLQRTQVRPGADQKGMEWQEMKEARRRGNGG